MNGTCRFCGEQVEVKRPRGWNLRTGLVVLRAADGKHRAYLNPLDSYEANCTLAALNSEHMQAAQEFRIHGEDCGELISCFYS